jgi:transcriptional regulator NrdR family protein
MFASECLGARITKKSRETATQLRPLAKVFEEVKKWLNNEHGHEVRAKTIAQQIMYQLEYERDKQLVLQQHASPN